MAQDDSSKASQFITYLMNSPQIKSENFLTAETMIHAFIAQNREQLKNTFRGANYFPHLQGDDAIRVVVTELYNMIREQIFKPLTPFVNEADFSFLNKLRGQDMPPAFHRGKISELADVIVKNRDVRANFSSAYNMLTTAAVDRYITDIFQRRDFIYNELVRVQKTFLEVDEYINFFKLLLLVKHYVHIKVPLTSSEPDRKYALTDVLKMPGKLDNYIVMLTDEIRRTAPNITERIVQLAVKANMPDTLTALDEGSARLMFILCSRFHNYKAVGKVDRGAESPDKSWFAIARKNAKMFGFEKNMLEELYRIAGDNNW